MQNRFKGFKNLYLIFLFIFFCSQNLYSQDIINIRFEQEGKKINIYYDITFAKSGQKFNIKVYCSEDGGQTWGNPLKSVTGAVGKNQTAGFGKKITWNVLADREKLIGDVKFRIKATVQDEEVQIVDLEFEEEEEAGEGEIFFIVEDMPSFNGKGLIGFRDWVMKNLQYPEIAAEHGISGTVIVQFIVEPTGLVNKVTVVRGVDSALDKEAIRVVKTSPKWTAGKQRGKAVRVSFTFPIKFILQ